MESLLMIEMEASTVVFIPQNARKRLLFVELNVWWRIGVNSMRNKSN